MTSRKTRLERKERAKRNRDLAEYEWLRIWCDHQGAGHLSFEMWKVQRHCENLMEQARAKGFKLLRYTSPETIDACAEMAGVK